MILSRRSWVVGMLVGNAAVIASPRAGAQIDFATGRQVQAATQLDALFAAMGGRGAWAALRGYAVHAQHHLAAEVEPFENWIWFDFTRPRLRIESELSGLRRVRVLDGDSGWRRRGDEAVLALTAEEVAREREWWASNVYRTVARLARGEPGLAVQWLDDGRLRVTESGAPLIWLRLNRRGEPIAFGTRDTAPERGTIFGPLAAHGALRFPSFSVNDQGRWRAIPRRFEADPALPDSMFASPPPR
jgi:hypothetical protein